jgi:trans-2-enoyl-CoA reductase
MLAAAVNPSDINTIEGKYPLAPATPAVAGFEGVGVVEAVGAGVSRQRVGDHVVPIEHGQGTWCTLGRFQERSWYRVPADLPTAAAGALVINPPTALRLLEEFVPLRPGDSIALTGASSAVGRYLLQLARWRGVNAVAVVRARRDAAADAALAAELKALGAAVVSREGALREALAEAGLPPPVLGLDCVAGEAGGELARALAPGGTLVVYGGMAQASLKLPPSLLIFKNLTVRGFW